MKRRAPSGRQAGDPSRPPSACTIIAKNYLAHAAVLARSYLEHHPDARFYVLVVDGPPQDSGLPDEVEVIGPEDLAIPRLRDMCMRYDVTELCTAVKPSLLSGLLTRFDNEWVCYLDPDILISRPLDDSMELMRSNSIVLIPHLLDPIPRDGRKPSEQDILIAGAYNLGFIGLRRSEEATALLDWWMERLEDDCRVDVANGLFVDQKWIDLVPSLFPRTGILRDETYDVAYWNIHSRNLDRRGDEYLINGRPLAFFHFSGFDPDQPRSLSKHQSRTQVVDDSHLAELLDEYANLLRQNGYDAHRTREYGYATLSDGTQVTAQLRSLYGRLDADRRAAFGDPFSTSSSGSFFAWATQPSSEYANFTPLAMEVYRSRPDLMATFPDVDGSHRGQFLEWLNTHGARELATTTLSGASAIQLSATTPVALMPGGPTVDGPRDTSWEEEIGPFLMAVYRARPDVVATYPDIQRRDRDAFLEWARTLGALEMSYDPTLVRIGQALPDDGRLLQTLAGAGVAGAREHAPDVEGINVIGYLRNESGVGAAARGYVDALQALRVPVSLKDVSHLSPNRSNDRTFRSFDREHPYDVNLVCVNADQHFYVRSKLEEDLFPGRYNIAVWFWELGDFPQEWHDRFVEYDEIWAASSFIANTLGPIAPIPVVRVPPVLDGRSRGNRRRGREAIGAAPNEFVFLYVFDFHSSIERKNPFGLIQAFRSAFSKAEPVRLVIKCVNEQDDPGGFGKMVELADGHRVSIFTGYWSPKQMQDLMAACDSYASLHRSEGLGLTMAEAMMLGKPTIGTAWSANTDFMTVSNSFLVRYDLAELNRDYGPYRAGQIWADPSVEHAAELMSFVYGRPDEASAVAAIGKREARAWFSAERVANIIERRLEVIRWRRLEKAHPGARPLALQTSGLSSGPGGSAASIFSTVQTDTAGNGAEYPRALDQRLRTVESELARVREVARRLAGRVAGAERLTERLESHLDALKERVDDAVLEEREPLAAATRVVESEVENIEQSGEAHLASVERATAERIEPVRAERGALVDALSRRLQACESTSAANAQRIEAQQAVLESASTTTAEIAQRLQARPYMSSDRFRTSDRLDEPMGYVLDSADAACRDAAPGFADLFRGSEEFIADRQRIYLTFFEGRRDVVDLGCGRGEFLRLLRERGLSAIGVEIDRALVERCREDGLDVVEADALEHLRSSPEASFDGIFSAQFVEHVDPDRLLELLSLSRSRLRPGGIFIAETVNPECFEALKTFHVDLTHRRPIFPQVLLYLCQEARFPSARIFYPLGGGFTQRDYDKAGEYAVVAVV